MKKLFSIIALILAAMLLFSACNEGNTPVDSDTETEEVTDAPETNDPEEDPEEDPTPPSEPTGEPIISTYKDSIKILAVGNSFSVDAMEHLAVILKDAGVKEVVLGNLYIAGCSVWNHWNHTSNGAKENQADYKFYVNKGNGWTNSMETMKTGLLYEDWDIITLQQVSQWSGKPDELSKLPALIDYVKATTPNKEAKLFWHMTWAYESTFSNADKFGYYNNDQMTMYNAITDLVQTKINTNASFTGFIPSGTAIQNLRTSYLGDTLTRDGYHMSLDIGRYTAALMWFKELTGAPISGITAVPTAYPNITEHLPAIKDAVNNAYTNKLQVTKSAFPGDNTPPAEQPPVDLTAMTDADKAHLTGLGLNPANYKVLDLELTMKAYYNSTSTSSKSSLITTASNSSQYMATRIFTKDTLPVGSVINVASGYKYRLEGWQTLNTVNSLSRLTASDKDIILSAADYEKYNHIAFNISKAAGGTVSDADTVALRIYVPVN